MKKGSEFIRTDMEKGTEFIKKVGEDGGAKYFTPDGEEISFHRDDLQDSMDLYFVRLERLIEMLGEGEYHDVGFIVEPMIREQDKEVRELLTAIDSNVGRVWVDRSYFNHNSFRGGQILGVGFEPANGKTQHNQIKQKKTRRAEVLT